MDCLFCKIIKGEIPSDTIYEDEIVKVFLDINPTTNGDSLIVPKKHLVNFQDINQDILIHINEVAKKLYPIYQEKLHCDGLTLTNNAFFAQEIKHYHMHFIPRYVNDNVKHLSNKSVLEDVKDVYNKLTK